MDYKDDLDWIINFDVPKEVIEYASFLKSRNIVRVIHIKLVTILDENIYTREKSQSEFTVGEIPLKAMSTQLDSAGLYRDDAGQYKVDGIITLYGIHRLEILLLETSSHFGVY
ncbi:hypothetical protein BD560DRAFT_489169 [Blakeslea trispora]|nr:hypothetical protein BD560DRAFT_489169 [Blakeslea trispora]